MQKSSVASASFFVFLLSFPCAVKNSFEGLPVPGQGRCFINSKQLPDLFFHTTFSYFLFPLLLPLILRGAHSYSLYPLRLSTHQFVGQPITIPSFFFVSWPPSSQTSARAAHRAILAQVAHFLIETLDTVWRLSILRRVLSSSAAADAVKSSPSHHRTCRSRLTRQNLRPCRIWETGGKSFSSI